MSGIENLKSDIARLLPCLESELGCKRRAVRAVLVAVRESVREFQKEAHSQGFRWCAAENEQQTER